MEEGKNLGGRPTDYREEYCELAYNYCILGATDKQLASFFDVSVSTLNLWKKKHPEFSESLKRGKVKSDAEVALSLFNRAKGYSHNDTKFATHEGLITDSKVYTKHHPPDTTAAIFWLKNRQPELWRDKREIDHQSSDDSLSTINTEKLTTEQLIALKGAIEQDED